jgi:hypothetical protein
MNSNQSGDHGGGNAQHGGASTSLGGDVPTSGAAGSTPTRETQAETGGSGGAGLARNEAGESRPQAHHAAAPRQAGEPAPSGERKVGSLAGGSAMNAHKRGFQDTRSDQAGGSETGLGSPETGANQDGGNRDKQAGAREPK